MYGDEHTVWARNPVPEMSLDELDELGAWAAVESGLEVVAAQDRNGQHGANTDAEMDRP